MPVFIKSWVNYAPNANETSISFSTWIFILIWGGNTIDYKIYIFIVVCDKFSEKERLLKMRGKNPSQKDIKSSRKFSVYMFNKSYVFGPNDHQILCQKSAMRDK